MKSVQARCARAFAGSRRSSTSAGLRQRLDRDPDGGALAAKQKIEHLCAVEERMLEGGERWEFSQDPGLVTLRSWKQIPGVEGWLLKLRRDETTELGRRKRLAYLRFEAERIARLPRSPIPCVRSVGARATLPP